jgi:hypothetical protein
MQPMTDLAPMANKPVRDDRTQEHARALKPIVLEVWAPRALPCSCLLARSYVRKMPRGSEVQDI